MAKKLDHEIIGLALVVNQFEVIHMEAYCHMKSVNHLDGDERIVWIDPKSDIRQTFGEVVVVE